MNPDSIRIAIFGVRSADAINPDSIRIEVLVRRTFNKLYVYSYGFPIQDNLEKGVTALGDRVYTLLCLRVLFYAIFLLCES